jgi:hypothetical protein
MITNVETGGSSPTDRPGLVHAHPDDQPEAIVATIRAATAR